jgi:hypothetical protein
MTMSINSDGVVKVINCLVDAVERTKRLLVSCIVLAVAAFVTLRPEGVDPSNAGMWVGFAGSVVSVYIGSKTVSQVLQPQHDSHQQTPIE